MVAGMHKQWYIITMIRKMLQENAASVQREEYCYKEEGDI